VTPGDTQTGVSLDQRDFIRRRDAGGMLGHIAHFPDQLRSGWRISRQLTLGEAHRSAAAVAVLGMGGSAVCGDLVRAIFADRLTVPLVSIRDYDLPAWVGRSTLVVAVSHSGATEETISALSAALERRCPVVAITTGGPMGDVAARVDLPRLVYPDETPPRASLGYTLALLAGTLERAGMLPLDEREIEEAAAASRRVSEASGPEIATETNPAKQLAWACLDRLPVIEGSGPMAAVARRWKTQLNENSKSAAAAEELPEATHNTVVGYAQPDTLRDHQFVALLGGAADNPRNAHRGDLSAELLLAAGISHQRIPFAAGGRLAEACSAITLGDYVSAYLGLLYGEDPGAAEVLTLVKASMSAFDPTLEGDAHDGRGSGDAAPR
jgi:glucose/mannose-6-phosphate isomerase